MRRVPRSLTEVHIASVSRNRAFAEGGMISGSVGLAAGWRLLLAHGAISFAQRIEEILAHVNATNLKRRSLPRRTARAMIKTIGAIKCLAILFHPFSAVLSPTARRKVMVAVEVVAV
jgi:hypothetical protein